VAAGGALTHRLFLAFDLDEACREALTRLVDRLTAHLESAGIDARRVKWVVGQHLHVTVRFLGAVPGPHVGRLRAVLAPAFSSPMFVLRFDRLGVFPAAGRPRVIWVGDSAGARGADRARRELDERLAGLGLEPEPESRPFQAHVTLGRFREPPPAVAARAIRELRFEPLRPVPVSDLTLYESQLSSRGPAYVVQQRSPLDRPSPVGIA
jgi:2'-5' RNA ligase